MSMLPFHPFYAPAPSNPPFGAASILVQLHSKALHSIPLSKHEQAADTETSKSRGRCRHSGMDSQGFTIWEALPNIAWYLIGQRVALGRFLRFGVPFLSFEHRPNFFTVTDKWLQPSRQGGSDPRPRSVKVGKFPCIFVLAIPTQEFSVACAKHGGGSFLAMPCWKTPCVIMHEKRCSWRNSTNAKCVQHVVPCAGLLPG